MVSAHALPADGPLQDSDALTNRVIKILCYYGSTYKTFGENIILLLNRESKSLPDLFILEVVAGEEPGRL